MTDAAGNDLSSQSEAGQQQMQVHMDIRVGDLSSPLHLRKGVAARLMHHILEEARRRSYQRLSLETGSMEAFAPARSLYASLGSSHAGRSQTTLKIRTAYL